MGTAPYQRYGNHPMVKYVRSLDGDFYLTKETAEMLGCTAKMLAYLRRRDGAAMGPSHQIQYGGTTVNLYSATRIAEITERIRQTSDKGRGRGQRGRPPMWTTTEATRRQREKGLLISYRNRGAEYAAQGKTEQAARMEKLRTALKAKRARDSARRHKKIYGDRHT